MKKQRRSKCFILLNLKHSGSEGVMTSQRAVAKLVKVKELHGQEGQQSSTESFQHL